MENMVSDNPFRGGLHLVHGDANTGKTELLRTTVQQAHRDKFGTWVATATWQQFVDVHPHSMEMLDDEHRPGAILRLINEQMDHLRPEPPHTNWRPLVLVFDDGDAEELFTGGNLEILTRIALTGQGKQIAAWIALPELPAPHLMNENLRNALASVTATPVHG